MKVAGMMKNGAEGRGGAPLGAGQRGKVSLCFSLVKKGGQLSSGLRRFWRCCAESGSGDSQFLAAPMVLVFPMPLLRHSFSPPAIGVAGSSAGGTRERGRVTVWGGSSGQLGSSQVEFGAARVSGGLGSQLL